MMDSAWSAAGLGAAFGVLNGWASRTALRRTLDRPDAVFHSVFVGGLVWRLTFLAVSVWLLRYKKYIIILPFAAALIFTQFVFEVIPLRKDGTKRDP